MPSLNVSCSRRSRGRRHRLRLGDSVTETRIKQAVLSNLRPHTKATPWRQARAQRTWLKLFVRKLIPVWQGNLFSVYKVAQNLNETDQWCFKIQNPLWIITSFVLHVPAPVSTLSPDHAWPGHFTSACSLLAVQLYYSTMGGRTGPLSRRDTRGTRQSSTQQWRSLQRDWQNCSETFEHLVTKKREMSIRTNRLSVRFKMWRLIFDLFSESVWCAAAPPTNYKLSYVIVYQSSESENIKLQSRAESWNRNSSTITQTILGATCIR